MSSPEELARSFSKRFDVVAIAGSAGAYSALNRILPALAPDVGPSWIIVIHRPESSKGMAETLGASSRIQLKDAEDKEPLRPGRAYMAPPGYHLLLERNGELSLTVEEPVLFSRPSINVLFESVADAKGKRVLGVVLSGANSDGALGLKAILEKGGVGLVQEPTTAEQPAMPSEAIRLAAPQLVMTLPDMIRFLGSLT